MANEQLICILSFLFPGASSALAIPMYMCIVTYAFVIPSFWPSAVLQETLEKAKTTKSWLREQVARSGDVTGMLILQAEGQRRLDDISKRAKDLQRLHYRNLSFRRVFKYIAEARDLVVKSRACRKDILTTISNLEDVVSDVRRIIEDRQHLLAVDAIDAWRKDEAPHTFSNAGYLLPR
ncbi:hypothetical protein BDZ89DRAFT_1071703 [Hymenopellis radicata]|nr:hypothetical protein BDZ89DRAFT_1071703 [Hymenopellis radicata]